MDTRKVPRGQALQRPLGLKRSPQPGTKRCRPTPYITAQRNTSSLGHRASVLGSTPMVPRFACSSLLRRRMCPPPSEGPHPRGRPETSVSGGVRSEAPSLVPDEAGLAGAGPGTSTPVTQPDSSLTHRPGYPDMRHTHTWLSGLGTYAPPLLWPYLVLVGT